MQIVRKTWDFVFSLCLSVSVSLCVSLSLCVVCCVLCVVCCVLCVVEEGRRREGERRRGETNRTVWAKVSLKIAGTEQPYQVIANDWRNRGHVVLSLSSV